jgi:hypothetical protein
MDQVDPNSTRRKRPRATLAIAVVTSAFALTIALPATSYADPEPAPPSPSPSPTAPPPSANTPTPAPATNSNPPPPGAPASPNPQPGDPNATPPPPADPNAPPPSPVDPNAGRISNTVGGFSYVLPAGWVQSDASHLDYGSELLSKTTGQPPAPGQAPSVANDTRIVMGRLDQKLYASAEPNNAKAAVRLGSDMGEFFMPYPGTRVNQEASPLTGANGITGSASFYEVKFSDPNKPNGQIWTGVVSSPATTGPPQRWFVVWLGTSNDPVDKGAAKALAESIQPWSGPAASPAPGAPAPGAPAPGPSPAPGAPAPAPAPAAPAPAPAGEATPTPTPTQQQPTLPA